MKQHRVLVVSDNEELVRQFMRIVSEQQLGDSYKFDYKHHYKATPLAGKVLYGNKLLPINLKEDWQNITRSYDVVISAHCKQIFPDEMVKRIRCVNIHPGYNPYNRGWFPQVFSILNGKPLGATIHEIDGMLDHGAIIAQETVPVYKSDTSLTAYSRVQAKEVALLEENITRILSGNYEARRPEIEGNINLKKDFNELCEISLKEKLTFGEAIDRLRALSHEPYDNAYFINPEDGEKIWVSIRLKTIRESDES